ncbi:unnamed protein product [Discosporangium mesarthrocarpum]
MSTRKGGAVRKPSHQNKFAFRHNPKSKKTSKILALPNEGLCPSCHDKIEWRKKYRKYKPLKQPATCNDCHKKTVTAAYHKICRLCARERRVCAWCCTKGRRPQAADTDGAAGEGEGEGVGEGAWEGVVSGADMEEGGETDRVEGGTEEREGEEGSEEMEEGYESFY